MDLSVLPSLAPRLLIMAGLLVASAFFSGSETSLFSLSRVQRERMARSARPVDRTIVRLLADPRRLIATILLGNELVNITFSSLSTSVVGRLAPGWGRLAVILLTTLISVPLILVFGEITPKSVALAVAERWARISARLLGLFAVLVTPIRIVVHGVAGGVVRLLGGGASAPPPRALGEAEFKALVDVGSEEGTLEAAERRLIHNVFAFGDRTVADLMTQVRRVFALSYDLPIARLAQEIARAGFSRVPIFRRRKEDIVGIVYAKDLVGFSAGGLAGRGLKDLLRPPVYVPKTTKCDRLFREFQRRRTHLALVVDEYGRLVGLVTMEDLLEELFGEIRDEKRGGAAAPVTPAPGGDDGEGPKP
jgi:putative hemolysin